MTWEEQAECKKYPAAWWFSDELATRNRAIAVCDECPVAEPCLAGALERKERFGVWGGRDLGAPERHRRYREAVKLRQKRQVA